MARPRRPSSPASPAAPPRRSGWAAARSAASGTRTSRRRARRGDAVRAGPGRRRAPCRSREIDVARGPRRATGLPGLRPRARRRPRAGLGRASRRRAGDRQVDAPLPGGARTGRAGSRRRPLRERRGVRGAGPPARRAARASATAASSSCRRPTSRASSRRRRRGARRRSSSIRSRPCGSRRSRRRPARSRRCARRPRELTRYAKARGVPVLLVGHVTKDGSLAGPEVARASRRRGRLDRGRPRRRAAAPARDEEPVRPGRRDRALRDDGGGPRGAARRLGRSARRAPAGPAGQRRDRRPRGDALGARRDPGARRRRLRRLAAARRRSGRRRTAGAAARGARGRGSAALVARGLRLLHGRPRGRPSRPPISPIVAALASSARGRAAAGAEASSSARSGCSARCAACPPRRRA